MTAKASLTKENQTSPAHVPSHRKARERTNHYSSQECVIQQIRSKDVTTLPLEESRIWGMLAYTSVQHDTEVSGLQDKTSASGLRTLEFWDPSSAQPFPTLETDNTRT